MAAERNTVTVAVANQKGGVGKTTTAVNLAAALSRMKRSVLLVDLDPQANATSGLGLQREQGVSLYRVLTGEADIADVIRPTRWENINAVPSEVDLAGIEIELARRADHLTAVRAALRRARESRAFDYILLDCPPSLGILMTASLAAADKVVVPMQSEYYALEGLAVITSLVDRRNGSGAAPGLSLGGILMTMYDGRTRLASDVVAEVSRHFGPLVFKTVIPRNIRISEAPSFGQPAIFYDPACRGSAAYSAFAREFAARFPTRGAAARPEPPPAPEPQDAAAAAPEQQDAPGAAQDDFSPTTESNQEY